MLSFFENIILNITRKQVSYVVWIRINGFNEVDALLGKRSEVSVVHDSFANIETGYLLQRMEENEGAVLLTTNLRKNLDDAFLRQMRDLVEFMFP